MRTRNNRFGLAAALLASVFGFGPTYNSTTGSGNPTIRPASPDPGRGAAAAIPTGYAPGQALAALLSGGSGRVRFSGGGVPPKVWGMSRACARMVRKSRLRAAGIGGQRQ